LYRSELGRAPKKVYTLKFSSLWQMTDEQSAGVTGTIATAVATLVDKQVMGRDTGLKEVRQLATVTGFGSNITDGDIKEAEKQAEEMRENPPDPLGNPADVSPQRQNAG
jgi:hypothetical protein